MQDPTERMILPLDRYPPLLTACAQNLKDYQDPQTVLAVRLFLQKMSDDLQYALGREPLDPSKKPRMLEYRRAEYTVTLSGHQIHELVNLAYSQHLTDPLLAGAVYALCDAVKTKPTHNTPYGESAAHAARYPA